MITLKHFTIACILVTIHSIHIEEHPIYSKFFVGFGDYIDQEFSNHSNVDVLLDRCLEEDSHIATPDAKMIYFSRIGFTLDEIAVDTPLNPYYFHLSHDLNRCASQVAKFEKYLLWHISLALWPWNTYSVKNIAYSLEWDGIIGAVKGLYTQAIMIEDDPSLRLQCIFACPPILWNEEQAFFIHLTILHQAYLEFNRNSMAVTSSATPYELVRELQLGMQYTGISSGITSSLYGILLLRLFPPLSTTPLSLIAPLPLPATNSSRAHLSPKNAKKNVIKLGIVPEHHGNSSPGLCIQNILVQLSKLNDFEIYFFDRETLNTYFAMTIREIATQVLMMNEFNVEVSKNVILSASVDILLYIALPTEKFTVLLSNMRLVPIQIAFGIGHPITSGSLSIDYSVVSSTMIPNISDLSMVWNTNSNILIPLQCAELLSSKYFNSSKSPFPPPLVDPPFSVDHFSRSEYQSIIGVENNGLLRNCMSIGPSGMYYSEQLVIFDTIGYFIEDPSLLHDEVTRIVNDITSEESNIVSCSFYDERLIKWGLYPKISAIKLRLKCSISSSNDLPSLYPYHLVERKDFVNLYSCIQLAKKMHPLFDRVLREILQRDPNAIILVSNKAKDLIPRWLKTLQLQGGEAEIERRFIFMPRLAHDEYMLLLSLSGVFLNTIPFGAGITSSEAISMCVPVIVYPKETSVLQLALGQIRSLGQDLEGAMVAHTFEEYVSMAINIASANYTTKYDFKSQICQRKPSLFGSDALDHVSKEWELWIRKVHSSISI